MPELILIIFLIIINGFFAAVEMALVAAKKPRLNSILESGDPRAQTVINIQANPGQFLATIQIGITLVGALASAIGGAQAAVYLTPVIAQIPPLEPYAQTISITIVVLLISYLTLVIGELVPKRLALRMPESTALQFSGPFMVLSRIAYIPMKILDISAEIILKFFPLPGEAEPSTSEEEIEMLVRQASIEGIIEPVEEKLISGVFEYADLRLWDVMTPRTSIIAIEAHTLPDEALKIAKKHGFSRYPLYENNLDSITGYLHIKDLLWASEGSTLSKIQREVIYIPGGTSLPDAFNMLTKAGKHMAIVLDEFGGTDGLLTLEDLLEVIFGEIEDEHSPLAELPEHPKDNEWVFSGTTPISVVEEHLKVNFDQNDNYVTLAGFILSELGEIPNVGDHLGRYGYDFIVTAMDRLRIAEIKVTIDQSTHEPEE
jgi:putative hemolysin